MLEVDRRWQILIQSSRYNVTGKCSLLISVLRKEVRAIVFGEQVRTSTNCASNRVFLFFPSWFLQTDQAFKNLYTITMQM